MNLWWLLGAPASLFLGSALMQTVLDWTDELGWLSTPLRAATLPFIAIGAVLGALGSVALAFTN